MSVGAALFDTPVGACALAWRQAGLRAICLPERDRDTLLRRLQGKAPGATLDDPPRDVADAIARIVAMIDCSGDSLADLPLDLDGIGEFERRVYARAQRIGPGETATYGHVARDLGDVGLSRRIGQALGRNPLPIVIPCHRVLAASGRAGGFSAPGGLATKMRLLTCEARARAGEGLFPALPFAVRASPRG